MVRIALALVCLLAASACLPGLPAVPLNAARDPAQDVSTWPAADAALHSASAVMSQLSTLREKASTRTYRNDELFLSVDAERAYVAPDRRYEKVEGRSAVEAVGGETVQIGARFFKRVGIDAAWQQIAWTESFAWPAREYLFGGLRNVTYVGPGDVNGRPARILLLQHEGDAESRNAGWQFQTRLWIDPSTNYFLRRETTGTRQEPDLMAGKPLVQRYEGNWTYTDHDGSIAISAPLGPN
jgi:hypothetical protein